MSHNDFLRKCSENKVIPLSYQVFLEPRIGNHDENFLKGYHDTLSGFSSQVMVYTAKYCKENITDCETQQENDKRLLSISSPKELIKKILGVNQAKCDKTLKDIKEQKFIRLKYHSNSSRPRQTMFR